MANGKIKADTLEHSTAGSLDTQYVVSGSAKAWINIDMINAVTLDSLNSSGITDVSTGVFRDHLAAALVNANYAVTTSAMDPTKTDSGGTNRTADGTPSSTTQFVMRASAYDNTANDVPAAAGTANGDLA
jgi:hypothetical protein